MKKAGFFTTTVSAIGLAFQSQASDVKIIDDVPYAKAVATSLSNDCPKNEDDAKNQDKIKACLKTTVSAAYDNAVKLSTYIKNNLTNDMPFWAGAAQGDMLANCERPVKNLVGKEFSSLEDYSSAALGVAEECVQSKRRAQDAVGINFNPTADKTIANQINCMNGHECVKAENTAKPLLIPQ